MKLDMIAKEYKQNIQDLHNIQVQFMNLAGDEKRPIRQICCFEQYPLQKKLGARIFPRTLIPEWVILPGSRAIGISDYDDTGYQRVVLELLKWLRELTGSGRAEEGR